MLKYIRRLSTALNQNSAMFRKRYFSNPEPDYVQKVVVSIPESDIKKKIDEYIDQICKHLKPTERNGGDGVYLGTAGVAYMFFHLSKNEAFKDQKQELLRKAITYLAPALTVATHSTNHREEVPSFVLGNSGIYAVAAAIHNSLGDVTKCNFYRSLFYEAAAICKDQHFLRCGSDELFVGRAGYILGALWLAKETSTPIKTKDIYDLCNLIIKSGREYAISKRSASPLMYSYYQVEYLGAAHGLSSILQVLLCVPRYLESNFEARSYVLASIDYLLNLQNAEGNFPSATDEIGQKYELVHWCHGAPGIFYLMAKAYLVFNEGKYLESCKKMGELIWNQGLLKKGPGLCHGLAGNGYVFLCLYRMTNEEKYLHRAICFFKFLNNSNFVKDAQRPDHPYSLFEGVAGTVCYLSDMITPSKAVFPFFDIF